MRKDRGQATLPLLLLFVAGIFTAMGSWGLLRLHFRFAKLQLRLDSCVGRKAVELRDLLRSLDSSNDRITALRASIVAASLQPELIPPLQRWLEAEAAAQDFRLAAWRAGLIVWRSGTACSVGQATFPTRQPELGLRRNPQDPIGPQTLDWVGDRPRSLLFSVATSNRSAAAEVRSRTAIPAGKETWTAHWTVPPAPHTDWMNAGNRFWRR